MKAEITAAEKKYTDAINSGNIEGALECYTDDAKVLAPGAPILSGKAG